MSRYDSNYIIQNEHHKNQVNRLILFLLAIGVICVESNHNKKKVKKSCWHRRASDVEHISKSKWLEESWKSIVPFELVQLMFQESSSYWKLWKKWCKCTTTSVYTVYTFKWGTVDVCLCQSVTCQSYTHIQQKEEKGNLFFCFILLSVSFSSRICLLCSSFVIRKTITNEINYWSVSQSVSQLFDNKKPHDESIYCCFLTILWSLVLIYLRA